MSKPQVNSENPHSMKVELFQIANITRFTYVLIVWTFLSAVMESIAYNEEPEMCKDPCDECSWRPQFAPQNGGRTNYINAGQCLPNSSQLRSRSPEFAKSGPLSAELGPKPVDFRRHRVKLDTMLGRNRPKSAHWRPKATNHRPNSTEQVSESRLQVIRNGSMCCGTRPHRNEVWPSSATGIAQVWPRIKEIRSEFSQVCQNPTAFDHARLT